MQRVIQLSIMPWGMINCFLIKGSDKHILVDTGIPGSTKRIISQLRKANIKLEDIALIIVTHGHIDHFGSAAELKDILNAPILIHQLDQAALTSGKSLIETLKANNLFWDIVLKPKLAKDRAVSCEPDIILHNNEVFDLSIHGIAREKPWLMKTNTAITRTDLVFHGGKLNAINRLQFSV
ncbi:MAG: MBL fold metallo-hydrolase, partial [Sphingobacteriales bacterium]